MEESIPHHNWVITVMLLTLAYAVFIMFTPSIYQFVTTSRNTSEEIEVCTCVAYIDREYYSYRNIEGIFVRLNCRSK